MTKTKQLLTGVLVALALLFVAAGLLSAPVSAQDPKAEICDLNDEKDDQGNTIVNYTYDPATGECTAPAGQGNDIGDIFKTITNTLLFLVGALAVIMLIIGGFRYVVSGGDANAVTGAKNTILYAIVGIVVAFLAFAAVNFVTNRL